MNKYILLLLFSINFFLCTFSQDNYNIKNDLGTKLNRPTLLYKLPLLSQLDFNSPSIQFGLEVSLSDRVGLHQEFGYVNNWLNPLYALLDNEFSAKIKLKNGFKYIIELKFSESRLYVFNKYKIFASRMFLAPALDYRFVVIERQELVAFKNNIQKDLSYQVQRMEYGLNLKYGFTTGSKKTTPIEFIFGAGEIYNLIK